MTLSHKKRLYIAVFLIFMTCFSMISPVFRSNANAGIDNAVLLSSELRSQSLDTFDFAFRRGYTYSNFLDDHVNTVRPDYVQYVEGNAFTLLENADVSIVNMHGRENVLLWENRDGFITWEIDIPQAGLYSIALEYMSLSDVERNMIFELKVNDEIQFEQAGRILMQTSWMLEGPIRQDSRGNDIRPRSVPAFRWLNEWFNDRDGFINYPYLFYFNEGVNTIRLGIASGPILIDRIYVKNYVLPPTYAEYSRYAVPVNLENVRIQTEAEHYTYKSEAVIYPTFDRTDMDNSPSHPYQLRLNTVGSYENWWEQGQFIVWEVYVEEAGWYNLGLRVRQHFDRGQISHRRLYINGEVPFLEVRDIKFTFSTRWQNKVLGDENGAFLFYFNQGINTIRLEATVGDLGDLVMEMLDIALFLNYMYRTILMITGPDPDIYRDYQLEREIPHLLPAFRELYSRIRAVQEQITYLTQAGLSANAAIIQTMAIQLNSFINRPDTIPERMESFQWNISGFADFSFDLVDQPIEIDYFTIFSPDQETFAERSGFFARMWFAFRAFIGSFTHDFQAVGDISEADEAITVWIGLWRDQVQLVRDLTDSFFTPYTGIPVNIKLVQQGLIPAVLSGQGPDVALFLPDADVVNLASRGGLTELSQFEGFDTIHERFMPYSMVPYQFAGGTYGLPIVENFHMMFVRDDILEELGLTPPATWDEFYLVMAVLQRRNMSIGVPIEDLGVFASILYQAGGTFYNEEQSRTMFHSLEAINAFRKWTEFYTKHSLPQDFNFYQRFRTGEMPIGIANYTTFNLLKMAAPEIRGLWSMHPIPGVVDEYGNINNKVVAFGQSAVILRDVANGNYENAWEFIKWFTSAQTQAQYGLELEALLGGWGRHFPASVEAFAQMPWEREQQQLIMAQWENSFKLPQVPGGYYVNRSLINAFRQVVYWDRNPRETLTRFNQDMNREIQRKRIEFGLE